VAAIDGFVKLIEDSHEKFSKDTKDSFGAIIQASDRLKQLVNDILQVARSDSGTIKVELKPVNIVDIFKKSLKEVEETALRRKIKITTKFAKDAMVQADEAKLSEVIENLLSNAIKYNKDKGLIEVLTMKEGKNIISKVSDTGVGIPKNQQDKVFAKFFRAQQKGTEEVSGTGLGLFVVKMLVEKMNGTISFISQEGKGTTFIFTLPEA
jgi:signal transduction histidine kinase